MSTATLSIVKTQLEELGLGFLHGGIETFLHDEARRERPLTETLADLFDQEITQRRQRAAKTRLKLSALPTVKTLEEFKTDQVEGITRKKLNELRTLAFIERKENIVLMGPSGLGKSHLLYALAHLACVEGHTAYHITGSQLKEDLSRAKEQNRLRRKLKALCKPRLLAIDEMGYERLTPEEASLFFQLVAQRYEKGSIVITTNKSFGQWGELMGDNAVATATLDRLLHHAQVIILKGDSYRLKNRMKLGLVPPLQ